MSLESMNFIANFLQSCVPVLSLIAYIPQWRKLIRSKSSNDISIHAWIIWCLSGAFALFYAIVQHRMTGPGLALIFSSATTLLFVLITVWMVFKYAKKNRR